MKKKNSSPPPYKHNTILSMMTMCVFKTPDLLNVINRYVGSGVAFLLCKGIQCDSFHINCLRKLIWNDRVSIGMAQLKIHMSKCVISDVSKCVYSPDGNRMLTISRNFWELRSDDDDTVFLWDTKMGVLIPIPILVNSHDENEYKFPTSACDFSNDGKFFATGRHKSVYIRESYTAKLLRTIELPYVIQDTDIDNCTFSPDDRLLQVSSGQSLFVFYVETGELHFFKKLNDYDQFLDSVFSPDGKYIGYITMDVYTIVILDTIDGSVVTIMNYRFNHLDSVATRIMFSPDSKQLARCCENDSVEMWIILTGEKSMTLKASQSDKDDVSIETCAFSKNGLTLITAGRDRKIILWDIKTGMQIASKTFDKPIKHCVLSPDNTILAITQGKSVYLSDFSKIFNRSNLSNIKI
jgi:WD40 repeat protein